MPNLPNAQVANEVLKQLAAAGRVTREQVEQARVELQARGGLPWTHLVAAGVPPSDVLNALCQVAQLPAAPVDRLRKASRATTQGLDAAACWRLLAAPFAAENGLLEIAFADPRVLDEAKNALPPHKAYLALETHVRTMLNGLFGDPVAAAAPVAKPIPLNQETGQQPLQPQGQNSTRATTGPVAATGQKVSESIGPYKVQKQIGEGGMASVFLAYEQGSQKPVALKVMKDHLTNDTTFVQRFAHEARATVGMRHDNIVEVLSYGDEAGRYYMACEFVDGGTVDELLTKMGKLPGPLAAEIFAQMLSGLGFAHGKNIVHRDLKPANLLLNSRGRVKVSDFGIAKTEGGAALTQTGLLIGTAAFMSPEQAQGAPVDTRSDLFTCGVILFQLVAGANPFEAESPTTSIVRIISGSYPLLREAEPSVPAPLEDVLDKLLQRDPAQRFSTAAEVLAELAPYLAEVRARYPTLVSDALANPEATKKRLFDDQADAIILQAKELTNGNPAERARAALMFFRATALAPDNTEAATLLASSIQRDGYRFGPSETPKILELERLLADNPEAPGPLQQLSQLYRMEGNLERSVIFLKRYLRLRPKDGYAATQLQQLTGDKIKIVTGPNPPARTSSNPAFGAGTAGLIAGIRTGGFKAHDKAPAAATGGTAAPMTATSAPVKPSEPAPEGMKFFEPGQEPVGFDWKPVARKVAPFVVGILLLVLILKGVGKFISVATKETEEKTMELSIGIAEQKAGVKIVPKIREHSEQSIRETGSGELRGGRKAMQSAQLSFDDGRFDDAIAGAQRVLNEYPRTAEAENARILIANGNLRLGRTGEASQALEAYLSQYPGGRFTAEAVLRRGELLVKSGQPRQAIGDFTEAVKKGDGTPVAAEALMLRGVTRAQLGERDDAVADLNLALTRAPQGSPVHTRAGRELAKLGQ